MSTAGDVAEWHRIRDDALVAGGFREGDVVGLWNGQLSKHTKGADMIGVITRNQVRVQFVDAKVAFLQIGAMAFQAMLVKQCRRLGQILIAGNAWAGGCRWQESQHEKDRAATKLYRGGHRARVEGRDRFQCSQSLPHRDVMISHQRIKTRPGKVASDWLASELPAPVMVPRRDNHCSPCCSADPILARGRVWAASK